MGEEIDRKLIDCYWFLQKSCSKGEKCDYRHHTPVLTNPTICEDWKQLKCRNYKCNFRHPSSSHLITKQTLCTYFLSGNCTRGGSCPYSHLIKSEKSDDLRKLEEVKKEEGRKAVELSSSNFPSSISTEPQTLPPGFTPIVFQGNKGSNKDTNQSHNDQLLLLHHQQTPTSNLTYNSNLTQTYTPPNPSQSYIPNPATKLQTPLFSTTASEKTTKGKKLKEKVNVANPPTSSPFLAPSSSSSLPFSSFSSSPLASSSTSSSGVESGNSMMTSKPRFGVKSLEQLVKKTSSNTGTTEGNLSGNALPFKEENNGSHQQKSLSVLETKRKFDSSVDSSEPETKRLKLSSSDHFLVDVLETNSLDPEMDEIDIE